MQVTGKEAPPAPLARLVLLQFNSDGSVVATERTEQVPGQIGMDGTEQALPKVVSFDKT